MNRTVDVKTGKEINWFIKISSSNTAISMQTTAIQNHDMEVWRFTFVKYTISNLPKVRSAKFVRSVGLFCFISISKFVSLKNSFTAITILPELT